MIKRLQTKNGKKYGKKEQEEEVEEELTGGAGVE